MSIGDEQQPAPSAGGRAPIRLIPRSIARLIVFLRYPIILAWIVAAVWTTMHLPGIGESEGGEIGGLAPKHSEALRAERASLHDFELR